MHAPKQYSIIKVKLKDIAQSEYNLTLEDYDKYRERTGYGMGMRLLFNLTEHDKEDEKVTEIVFVDISSNTNEEYLDEICRNGFILNGIFYMVSKRAASMSRNGILTAVDSRIIVKFTTAILMDIDITKNFVISKIEAYLGLHFSACHILENYRPYIVVIKDFERVVPAQKVFYCKEEESVSENGKVKNRLSPIIEERDIKTMPFDGTGLHSPRVTEYVHEMLDTTEIPTSIMWRFPFGKGLTHEMDFVTFGDERGISEITDYWGKKHFLRDVDIIITESMYKGLKYFREYDDYRDWEKYWSAFDKYGHAIGVAKWNYAPDREPVYTRLNYQILQDLEVSEEEFISLSNTSKRLVEDIISGKEESIWNFTGLIYKNKLLEESENTQADIYIHPQTEDTYFQAMLKNPHCLNDKQIQHHLYGLVKKNIDDMKCGKVYAKAAFRMIAPDVVALMEFALGLPVKGCLADGECFTQSFSKGIYTGDTIIERNPHLARSEHRVLNAVDTELARKWMGHLYNIIAVNSYDLTLQGLSGADLDGDLALVIDSNDCPVMLKGIRRDLPIVINIDEKATAVAEAYTEENIIKNIKFTKRNKIGEYSNFNTCYRNKVTDDEKLKQKWEEIMNIICIINAKEIDSAKTQVRVRCPMFIQKYARPLPYFMRYAGDYYARHKTFNMARSNMNALCYDIEKWQKEFEWQRNANEEFDHRIYMQKDFVPDMEIVDALKTIYSQYRRRIQSKKMNEKSHKNIWILKEMRRMEKECLQSGKEFDAKKARKYCNNIYHSSVTTDFSDDKLIAQMQCEALIADRRELANYLVYLCYEHIKTADKCFAWIMAGDGIVENIQSVAHKLPVQVKNEDEADFEYLGKRYKWQFYKYMEG